MRRRLSSIRARITLLTLVPLLALGGLWVFATGITYGEAHQLLQSRTFTQKSLLPTQRLVAALQKERRLSMWRTASGRDALPDTPPGGTDLAAQRRATDQARDTVRRYAAGSDLRGGVRSDVLAHVDAFVRGLGALDVIRRQVDSGAAGRPDVLREYDGMIDAGFALYASVVPGDGRIAVDARTLTSVGRAHEYLSREDALLTGAVAAGRLTAADRAEFAQIVGAQRYMYGDTVPSLPAADRTRYGALVASPEFARLRLLEDEIVRGARTVPARTARAAKAAGRPALSPRQWWTASDAVDARLYAFENAALDGVTDRATGVAVSAFARLAVAGGLGLLAVIASALLAYRVARRLLRECRTLADAVVDFARRRLPELAERVRRGEQIDPRDVVLPTPRFKLGEIQEISESFVVTRDAVLVAAAGEIAARRGISEVFVNLARRNQTLLHHQLRLLDRMEHRTEDPDELADLFRLDHLATRMRRHAEGLVILAGKSAGRGWRNPVPLVDVVRGAVAEVEDYQRVRLQPLPRIALLGAAVADVIHLLAEVVENATAFSPPGSPVLVSGHPVGHGYVLEIEDRGLGMEEAAIAAANARLADPPEFDPSDSAQLGLFVVARLAQRHGIKVTLRASPYGGITAIALIPGELIVAIEEPEPSARRSGPLALTPGPSMAVGAERAAGGVVRLVAEPAPEAEPVPERVSEPVSEPAPAGNVPVRAVEAPAEVPAEEPAPLESTDAGLPRRRRQANLAPQLRERLEAREGRAAPVPLPAPVAEPVAEPAPEPEPDPGPAVPLGAPVPGDVPPPPEDPAESPRSPEAMRSKLSAMQRGWQRGRSETGPAPTHPEPTHPEQEDDTR
ncbi:nitrate- and nitrite sensing domain-containing protein [Actinomadura atramentaria]|uniref:sensor histidine kinase n=1 Tax=Actinomadura atramentaria TaxID=1990 RepID=UPI0003724098|nr:nitrate- and nitrite sensing domain-containing protein [Actinomadura atramentaria]